MPELLKCYRCPWVDLTKPDYVEYHDREWGAPVHDDWLLFEFLDAPGRAGRAELVHRAAQARGGPGQPSPD